MFYNCPFRNTGADAFSIRINGQSHIAAVGTANGVSSCDHLKNLFLQLLNFSIIPNKKKLSVRLRHLKQQLHAKICYTYQEINYKSGGNCTQM